MSLDTKQTIAESVAALEGVTPEAQTKMVESLQELTTVLAENLFNERKATIEEAHQAALTALEESVNGDINAALDEALNVAVVEFMQTNSEKFDVSLKTDLAESFLKGLAQLVEEHGVLIAPDIASIQEAFTHKESQYIAEIERLEAVEESLTSELFIAQKASYVSESTSTMTVLQKEKYSKLAEDIETKDIESFKKSFTNLVEAFGKKEASTKQTVTITGGNGKAPVTESVIDQAARLLR